ncbi:MAG TPA: Hsp20/alpha crystallin family protein [Pseudolabrys sp.]|nr:Hsp20/alpha crystallin family protein [Pseudolabrys sp.]
MAQESKVPAQTRSRDVGYPSLGDWRPFENLRREIDRMFDDFWRFPYMSSPAISPSMGSSMSVPAVDVVEKPEAFQITAELPGMDEKSIEVKCAGGVLTMKGEKKDEREESKEGYHLSERHFGSFQRSFRIPDNVDAEKIDATFKNGVLTLTLPKTQESQKNEKKISVKAG